jgi:hypothetical protein
MTRDEALARIDRLASEPDFGAKEGTIEDARKLVDMLPERALSVLHEGWIRPRHDDPGSIEFFWSRSTFSIFDIGNRITILRTLGDGEFGVEPRPASPEEFDPSKWQRSDDGEPMVGILSLNREGAQPLIDAIFARQIGVDK